MLGKRSKLFFTVSLGVLIVAIIMAAWGFPSIVKKQIQKNIQLDNSSMMFEKWRKLPMPLTFKIYVFNVTNPEAINGGEKPRLAEIGPYVYKQYREKTIVGYGDNDTIKYTLKKTFVFDKNESGALTEDDEVTVINFSYMGAILTVQEIMPAAVGLVNQALEQFFTNLTDPFLRVRVGDLFFDGIYVNCVSENAALSLVCGKIKAEKPPTMRPSEDGNGYYFSMFSHLNTTETGPYEVIRGRQELSDLGRVVSYKGQRSMPQWGDQYCGKLNGTDSTIFPPIDESNVPERLYTFEPEICRSLYASLVGKRTIFNISSYYYEISESALASKSANPDNRCFCKSKTWTTAHDACLLMGVLALTPCQGAPAVASLPHFHLASDELLEYVAAGLAPDKEKHNSYVYIDPVTGAVLKGVRRLQLNIELRNIKGAPQLEKVPTGLFPLLWMEESAEIPPHLQSELVQSHALLRYVEAARWALLAAGLLLALAATATLLRAASLPLWPRHTNSVSFVLRPGNGGANKGI